MSGNSIYLHEGERDKYGLTVTLTDGMGTYRSRVFPGTPGEALVDLADYCDLHGVKVVCISSPVTIATDVKGRPRTGAPSVEQNMLGRIGRQDLIA